MFDPTQLSISLCWISRRRCPCFFSRNVDIFVCDTACLAHNARGSHWICARSYTKVSCYTTVHSRVLRYICRWLDETPVSRVISRTTNDIRAGNDQPIMLITYPLTFLVVDEVVTRYFHYVCDLSLSIIVSLAIILIFAPMFIPPSIVVALIGVWVGQVYIRTIMSVKREMSNARSPVLAHFGASVAGLGMLADRDKELFHS